MKDYYSILELDKTATQDEIKKAYRKLARQFHPDVSDAPNAEEKFKEINEAYSVLSDDAKKRNYDFGGDVGFGGRWGGGFPADIFNDFFRGFRSGQSRYADDTNEHWKWRTPEPIKMAINMTLKEVCVGGVKTLKFKRKRFCGECDGKGYSTDDDWEVCDYCDGKGVVTRTAHFGAGVIHQTYSCNECGGQGKKLKNPCLVCRGDGLIYEDFEFDVDIKQGVEHGTTLKITAIGNEFAPGKFGPVNCVVQILNHENLTRQGNDVVLKKEIDLKTALTGGNIKINLADDSEETVEIVPPVQPNSSIVLKSKGLPIFNKPGQFGDMHVVFSVKIPNLDESKKRSINSIL